MKKIYPYIILYDPLPTLHIQAYLPLVTTLYGPGKHGTLFALAEKKILETALLILLLLA